MSQTKRLVFLLIILATPWTGHSQTAVTPSGASGLLGQRYVDLSFGREDQEGFSEHTEDVTLGVNFPVAKSFDLSAAYSYGWWNHQRFGTIRLRSHTVAVGATGYLQLQNLKPFATVSFGHVRRDASLTFFGVKTDVTERDSFWGGAVGAEVPFGPVVFTPSISYQDVSGSTLEGLFYFGLDVNYWFTPRAGIYADATYTDGYGGSRSWFYTLGLRFKF